ncbi:MAG: TraC family protein [Patescibacteria group bacterium]
MAEKKVNKQAPPTQQYLDIAEVKYNTVVMKDGSLRAVLAVSSINFALKSEDEQNAIISSYVSFLNNISTPIQIVVQSRDLNIQGYLDYLKEKEREQTNRLLKIQTAEYMEYIKELVSIGKIMEKKFYVIVSYNPKGEITKGFFSQLSEIFKPANLLRLKEAKFLKYKEALSRRVDSVGSGLMSLGVSVKQLNTQELIELYYKTYNPETAKNQKLEDVRKLQIEL